VVRVANCLQQDGISYILATTLTLTPKTVKFRARGDDPIRRHGND
jgi:hypothetical protein